MLLTRKSVSSRFFCYGEGANPKGHGPTAISNVKSRNSCNVCNEASALTSYLTQHQSALGFNPSKELLISASKQHCVIWLL
jgi:hypothetical protein